MPQIYERLEESWEKAFEYRLLHKGPEYFSCKAPPCFVCGKPKPDL